MINTGLFIKWSRYGGEDYEIGPYRSVERVYGDSGLRARSLDGVGSPIAEKCNCAAFNRPHWKVEERVCFSSWEVIMKVWLE